jgi:hypothetical protein
LDAIAASGGRKAAERLRRIGVRRQRVGNTDPPVRFPPPPYTYAMSGRLWIPPPYLGGLRCCHVSRGFKPCLLAREGSGAATCLEALDLASSLGRAPAPPRVLQFSVGDE